jgi:hypothetical protein
MKVRAIVLLSSTLTFTAGIFAAPLLEPIKHEDIKEWKVEDSKAYARDKLSVWKEQEWVCLNNLWTKESNWRADAYNKIKVMGKNAGGIPQLLGLDPDTPAPLQIDRGLDYIYHRYGTPCKAWAFFKKNKYH